MMEKFLKSFFTLFVAMNVIGILPVFILLTEKLTLKEKNKTIFEGVLTAFFITLFFIFIGNRLFKILGIEVGDFMGHMGLFYGSHIPYSSPDKMVKRMEIAGVKLIIFCYHYTLFFPERTNEFNIYAVKKYSDKFKAYCGINPNYPEIISDLKNFEKLCWL